MSTTKERLARLETKVDRIEKTLDDIINNDLKSIDEKLNALTWRPKDYITLIGSLLAFIVSMATLFLK